MLKQTIFIFKIVHKRNNFESTRARLLLDVMLLFWRFSAGGKKIATNCDYFDLCIYRYSCQKWTIFWIRLEKHVYIFVPRFMYVIHAVLFHSQLCHRLNTMNTWIWIEVQTVGIKLILCESIRTRLCSLLI